MLATIQNALALAVRPRALPREVLSTNRAAIRQWKDNPNRTFSEQIPQGASYAAFSGVIGSFLNLIGSLRDMDSIKTIGKDLAIAGFAVLGGLLIHTLGINQRKPEQSKPNEDTNTINRQPFIGLDSPDVTKKDSDLEDDSLQLRGRKEVVDFFNEKYGPVNKPQKKEAS